MSFQYYCHIELPLSSKRTVCPPKGKQAFQKNPWSLTSAYCLKKSLPVLVFQLNCLDLALDLFQKPARHDFPLPPPPRGASSRPQHFVPTLRPPLSPPGPRQVYKHQPGARFPGSTSPSPSFSPPSGNIHFRAREPGQAGTARKGVRLGTRRALQLVKLAGGWVEGGPEGRRVRCARASPGRHLD